MYIKIVAEMENVLFTKLHVIKYHKMQCIFSDNLITDYYPQEDYVEEEYDYYSNSDDDDYELDNCDVDYTIYDMNTDDTCNHTAFNELTPINEIKDFQKVKNIKQCCPYHGYLFPDSCEVTYDFKHTFNIFCQLFLVISIFLT